MESGSFLLFGRDGAVGDMCMDALLPAGQCFVAPIQTEIHRQTDGATAIMTGDRIVREGRRVFAMILLAVHIVKQTADMFAHGVIEAQCRVSLRHTDLLRLVEEIRDPPVIDLLLEPRRIGKNRDRLVVSALKYKARVIFPGFLLSRTIGLSSSSENAKRLRFSKSPENIRVRRSRWERRSRGVACDVCLSPRG
jgi:hypothetical protein